MEHRTYRVINSQRCNSSTERGSIKYESKYYRHKQTKCTLSIILAGCPFNGPLSGTKYPTRAASPIQNASTPKSSLPFSKHRSCALLCAGFSMTREWRSVTIFILNYCFSEKIKDNGNAKSGPKAAYGNFAMRTKFSGRLLVVRLLYMRRNSFATTLNISSPKLRQQ